MSPALNGTTALQHFERGNAVEIRNWKMFDFYLGLPQILCLHEASRFSMHILVLAKLLLGKLLANKFAALKATDNVSCL